MPRLRCRPLMSRHILLTFGAFFCVVVTSRVCAGEAQMLIAAAPNSTSATLSLEKGETAELKFCSFSPVGIGNGPVSVIVTAEGQTFHLIADGVPAFEGLPPQG